MKKIGDREEAFGFLAKLHFSDQHYLGLSYHLRVLNAKACAVSRVLRRIFQRKPMNDRKAVASHPQVAMLQTTDKTMHFIQTFMTLAFSTSK